MTSLLAWWDFEQEAGDTELPPHDASTAYTLNSGLTSYIGTAHPKTGNGHLSNDGSPPGADAPALTDSALLNISGGFSIAGWFRPTGTPPSALNQSTILSKWRATTGQRGYWFAFDADTYRWSVQNTDGTQFDVEVGTPVVDEYVFFCVWFDPELAEIGLQIGAEFSAVPFSGTPEQPADVSFAFLFIGAGLGGWASDNEGQGQIDAVSAWNRAISPVEREILRNEGAGWAYPEFPGLNPTTQQQFESSYADVSGRDPLATALTQRTSAQNLADYLVSLYAGTNPRVVVKPVQIELGELDKTSPAPASGDLSRQIWIEDDRDPNFVGGRWATILGRSGGADPGTVELTLFIADNPESFVEPT